MLVSFPGHRATDNFAFDCIRTGPIVKNESYNPSRLALRRSTQERDMSQDIPTGTKQLINGKWRVFYDGYWIKAYDVPADTLLAKKRLIEALTRRLFNHVEHGLNVPGNRLEEARHAYETESEPARKRVKGAMLAGALFNRAADVFTKLVELQACGVEIRPENALMAQCGDHLQEALTLGRMVLHRSGEEGIDELWGEPFKAFAYPVEAFYKSRYVKIALTMREIDGIADGLIRMFRPSRMFQGIEPLLADFAAAAKEKSETLRTDEDIFDIWTSFVVSSERLTRLEPALGPRPTTADRQQAALGLRLINEGKDLVAYIARARVPMPKSAAEFIERCGQCNFAIAPPPRRSSPGDHSPSPEMAPAAMMTMGNDQSHKR
jgi:hypothetical protein